MPIMIAIQPRTSVVTYRELKVGFKLLILPPEGRLFNKTKPEWVRVKIKTSILKSSQQLYKLREPGHVRQQSDSFQYLHYYLGLK